jgi:hypothetical protein
VVVVQRKCGDVKISIRADKSRSSDEDAGVLQVCCGLHYDGAGGMRRAAAQLLDMQMLVKACSEGYCYPTNRITATFSRVSMLEGGQN